MVIRIADIVQGADTAQQGTVVYHAVRHALRSEEKIDVSFDSIKAATSSFANAAFAQLLGEYSLEQIKTKLRVVHSNRQINDMIKVCVERKAAGPL